MLVVGNVDTPLQPTHDSAQVTSVYTAAFPVLYLKHPIKIADLSRFAEDSLGMIISHKGLHKMTRLLKPIPLRSRYLLGMCLDTQGATDVTLLECCYLDTYDKAGTTLPFPDISAPEFPKDEEELRIVMRFQKEWFAK